jgi:hypothetical protein
MLIPICLLLTVTSWANPPAEKIIGLLEIPSIFGTSDPNGPPGQIPPKIAGAVILRAEPSDSAKVKAEVKRSNDFFSKEHGYGESSAVVFDKKDAWFQVKAKSTKGWIKAKDAGKFRSFEELAKGWVFVERSWDGRLYPLPKQTKYFEQLRAKGDTAERDLNVLSSKTVSGRLWFEVQEVNGKCEAGEETLGKKGWIPAYNDSGETNVWFYSRGC